MVLVLRWFRKIEANCCISPSCW